MDPADMADALLAVQMEKLHVAEALAARDNAVARLEDAYTSVCQKAAIILRLEQELQGFKRASTPASTNSTDLQIVSGLLATPPANEPNRGQTIQESDESQTQSGRESRNTPTPAPSEHSPWMPDKLVDSLQSNSAYCPQVYINSSVRVRESSTPTFDTATSEDDNQVSLSLSKSDGGAESTIAARQEVLAALPLPSGIPDDALQPIMLPAPYSLHEFLGNTTGFLKDLLTNYRVLAQITTYWCPEREEHGYSLTPVFKCSTNPRVATAHRWSAVDVIGQMSDPTECFYNKDGKWYYAGTYEGFRMDDLTVQEWEALSTETTQAIIKETLAGRKNVSPQNHYEIAQLYGAGALRVACIGLQCVGFNENVYRGVVEQSRVGCWGRRPAWAPMRTPTARSETTSDDGIPAVP
ncbi:hypothetical protein BS17DRAFT_212981 [Gyrodon lividus]|nr:hypothetical protein BS17DRAFT_212981 [Gyrodon lividus]